MQPNLRRRWACRAGGSTPKSRSMDCPRTSSAAHLRSSSLPSRAGWPQGGSATGPDLVWHTPRMMNFLAKWTSCKMASVVKRRRKDGSYSWYARFRDGRGKDVWKKCASAKDAKAYAAEAEVKLARSGG